MVGIVADVHRYFLLKLGGGRESYTVQRTAKRYCDDFDGNILGLGVPLVAAVKMAARELPPNTSRRRTAKKGCAR